MLGVTQSLEKKTVPDLSSMPKVELHLHLEGAPRWSTLREALHRHRGMSLPESPPWYEPEFRFTSFDECTTLFHHYVYPWLNHPILDLDAVGIAVTVNSDDPTFFGSNLTHELSRLIVERGATLTDLKRWTQNALRYALIPEEIHTSILSDLNEWLQNIAPDLDKGYRMHKSPP